MPATSAVLIAYFFSFLAAALRPLTVLMKQTRQPVRAIKQSIYLNVYDLNVMKLENYGPTGECLNNNH